MGTDQGATRLRIRCRKAQRGYLFGLPLLLTAVTAVLALLAVRLPTVATPVLLTAGALVWLLGLYYMTCVPGWLPGARQPRSLWLRAVILAMAAALVLAAFTLPLFIGRT